LAQAAILLLGLGALWTLWVQRALTLQDWSFAALAAFACVVLTARFVMQHTAPSGTAFKSFILFVTRSGAAWRNVGAVMAAALSADVKLQPGLVRVRLRGAEERAHAAFANLMSAQPGSAAVELDADGLLLHVLQEDGVDARELGRLESGLLGAVEVGKARP
jgi:multisubunit Na+/H+ antiporter MnhE subunit